MKLLRQQLVEVYRAPHFDADKAGQITAALRAKLAAIGLHGERKSRNVAMLAPIIIPVIVVPTHIKRGKRGRRALRQLQFMARCQAHW